MRRRHDHRSGTWRWQPRQRPAATANDADGNAANDGDRASTRPDS
ncbi:hypothetical protein [Pseudonocardia sp. ICBG601]|nr:hypothetical protein [Pseudonocardia sp. ICBG601]